MSAVSLHVSGDIAKKVPKLTQSCCAQVWYPVSCSSDLIMQQLASNDAEGDEMWHAVMQLIDDDFRRVSDQVRAEAKLQQ